MTPKQRRKEEALNSVMGSHVSYMQDDYRSYMNNRLREIRERLSDEPAFKHYYDTDWWELMIELDQKMIKREWEEMRAEQDREFWASWNEPHHNDTEEGEKKGTDVTLWLSFLIVIGCIAYVFYKQSII